MKLSKDNTINLEDFRAKDGHKISKVFTGRDRGLYVREQSKIDEIEQSYDEVKIIIPNNIYSINPSFFEELFVNIIKRLGKENFLKKIQKRQSRFRAGWIRPTCCMRECVSGKTSRHIM